MPDQDLKDRVLYLSDDDAPSTLTSVSEAVTVPVDSEIFKRAFRGERVLLREADNG